MTYVIYACSCGNYVASPTILAARERDVVKHVQIGGAIYCSNPVHGAEAGKIEMRRVVLEDPIA